MIKNPIEGIIEFNEKAGLLDKGLDSFNEAAYILEEGIEGFEAAFNGANDDGTMVKPGDKNWVSARQWALSLMNQIHQAFEARNLEMPSEVAEFDKAIDGIVFNVGKLAKMGLTATDIVNGINVVNECNIAKLGGPKDEKGKQLKPENWVGPEKELQQILDLRATNE